MFRLDNKTAIVTGGGSGIGKAIATVFAQQGAQVFIVDLDEKGATTVVKEITDAGFKASFKKCDVSQQQQVQQVMNEIAAGNTINILINNAGISHIGTAESTTEADFDRMMNVNVKGFYNCLHTVIPHLKEKGGVIINMASVAALVGIPDRFAYTMTKGAVAGMTLSVAKDYLAFNIRCNSISPARVHTPFVDGFISKTYPGREQEMFEKLSRTQPIGRMGKPEEVAALALFLCSDEASFITGCDYPVDGGFVKLNN